jgi:Na+/H+-dicarboxylate symporter
MSALKKIKLPGWIFIGLIAGILAGLCFLGNPDFTTNYIKPFGTIYINLLKFLVVPVVITSIISGVVSLGDVKRVGSIGWKTIVYYLGTTVVAIVIGLAFASLAKGMNIFPVLETSGLEYEAKTSNVMDVIVGIFPSNMWAAFTDANMLQVIVIALLFGVGILLAGDKARAFDDFMTSAYEVVMKVMMMIINITPIGVFCLMCNVVAVNGPSIVGTLFLVILVAYLAYIVHFLVCYGVSAQCLSKVGFGKFVKGIWPAMTVAFTTTSSAATLPLTIECSNNLGADPEVSSFVLPLGATINMDGTAIYQGVAAVFIASCYGISLTLGQMAMIVLTATLASIGTAGVSGAGMIMLAMVLESVGLPVEGIALIAGVDKIFDMGRTTLNIVGDSSCALYMSRLDRKRAEKLAAKN